MKMNMKMMFPIVFSMAFFGVVSPEAEEQKVEQMQSSSSNGSVAPVVSVPSNSPLQKRLDQVIQDFTVAMKNIQDATTKLREGREKEVQNVMDSGQSEIRKMLDIFRADGEFAKELNLNLTQRQTKLQTYQSQNLLTEQRKTLEGGEQKLIAGLQNLQERVGTVRTRLKEVDVAFTQNRNYIALLISQNNLQAAVKAAEDAMSSAEKAISNMDSFVKENVITTPGTQE